MKIGVPGRAFRMPENQENYSKDLERPNLNSPSWLHSNLHQLQKNYGDTNNYTPKHFWDQNQDTKNIGKECFTYRDQMGIKENHKIPRPSTAVRRHVKKISEEFTITQTKYENSTRPNGILIHIEPSHNDKNYGSHPGALNSVLSPKSHSGRHSLRKTSPCTKCSSSDDQVAPMITTPPVITKNGKCRYTYKHGALHAIDSSPSPSPRKGQNENFKRSSLSCITPFTASGTSLIARQGFQVEADGFPNHSRRRKSQSAHAGTSGGVLKVPFEQVKKAKQFTENAVREGKVFSIHGGFPAIREALTKRGWVEKVLNSIPYVNPHPQNCVCTNVGWHVPLPSHQIPLNHHLHLSNSSDITTSTLSVANFQSSVTANSSFNDSTNDAVISNALQSDVPGDRQKKPDNLEENNDKNSTIECPDEPSNSVDIEDASRISTLEVANMKSAEDSACKNNSVPENSRANVVLNEESYIETKLLGQEVNLENERCGGMTIDIDSDEYIKKMTKTINTAFLGPSEIREGLKKSINRKNLSIFQYSVPPYEKKRKSTFTKPESDMKSSKTDEEVETDKQELEEQNINEKDKENGEESVEEKIKGEEVNVQPYNPYPKLDVILADLDKPVVARVLRNIEPNFIWCWNRDSVSFKHLSKEQLVNRFPNTPFTTKFGLCETLQQLHWFSEAASVDSFVPRAYCIGLEDERTAFIHDYRTTACLNMLRWIVEKNDSQALQTVAHPLGEVPYRRIRQALQHVERFIQSCCHDDLDAPPLSPLREGEWDALLTAHHRIIHQGRRIKAPQHHLEVSSLVEDCRSALERVEPYWPQLPMDGVRNVWIVKPGAQSRGRGIFLLNRLEEILALVQSPLIYQTKYVVQKYMERPLLIHNTKFDIRQWFMVTDWNPLTLWMYKECYLRFCSQQYDLTNNDEAIHLSNNAIQCKYHNGIRDCELPEENMWDCHQFKEYLRNRGHGDVFSKIIFPGMKEALIATMLASQVQMDSFKHGYEFFGADFMLTEDFRPWLIEINSSPCMAPTTSVTKRMCYEGLQDTIKVVVDYRQNKTADTGNFELIYQDKEKTVSNLPYVGITLQVVGRQIWKGPPKQDKRKPKNKPKSLPKILKSIPLITLQLEDSGEVKPAKLCPILDCQKYSEIGPTLTAVVSPPSFSKNHSSSKCFSVTQLEDMNQGS